MTTKKPKTRKPTPDPKVMGQVRRKIIDKFAACALQMDGVADTLSYYMEKGCGPSLAMFATVAIDRISYCVQRCRYLIEARINTTKLDVLLMTLEEVCLEWGKACHLREGFGDTAKAAYEEHRKHLEENPPAN
jgi:hypothetical protein